MRTLFLAILATACSTTESDTWSPDAIAPAPHDEHAFADDALPPPGIAMQGTDLIPGMPVAFRMTGLPAGATAHFFLSIRSPSAGAGPCVGGTCGDLRNPISLGSDTANNGGVARVDVAIPPNATPGTVLYVQALVSAGGAILAGPVYYDAVLGDADADGFPTTTDCDDNDAAVFPGAVEVCDGRDNDCNGIADDGCDTGGPGSDADGDGFPAPLDCDDNDPHVYPGAVDVLCNGIDEDCDGIDPCGADADGDGFLAPQDCNDHDPSIFPGAVEICDLRDNDCNGVPDDGCDTGIDTGVTDADGDGVPVPMDCDDGNPRVFPGAVDVLCNGIDEDCDGMDFCGPDLDGDGFPAPMDCDDTDSAIHPGAREACDGIDNDCNAVIDDGCP